MYCIGNVFTKAINKHLLHLKICPQASGTAVLHCKQVCLIDNELTDCGGKWISNHSNSFKVVPEGAIDSVEVCIVVDVVKQSVPWGHSLTVVFSMILNSIFLGQNLSDFPRA